MGLFRSKKNEEFVDLRDQYKKQQAKLKEIREEQMVQKPAPVTTTEAQTTESGGMFGFLGDMARSGKKVEEEKIEVEDSTERKKRLAKRLLDMTNKIEEMGNQIYHLEQRIEVLERRNNVGRY